MIVEFNSLKETGIPNLNGGDGTVFAKMSFDGKDKIMLCHIPKGASIGMHAHKTSDEYNFVVSGMGKAVCNGENEELYAGCCHVCHVGEEHSIVNISDDDLVLYTVVKEIQS